MFFILFDVSVANAEKEIFKPFNKSSIKIFVLLIKNLLRLFMELQDQVLRAQDILVKHLIC